MSFRKIILAAAVAATALPSAFANSGATWVGGEAGFETHPLQSAKTREQVRVELDTFLAQGGRLAAGEQGYVADGTAQPVHAKTREQVRAELDTFLAQGGRLAAGEQGYVPGRTAPPVRANNAATMGNAAAPAPAAARLEAVDPYANGGPN